jgi:predicted acyltransferase
MEKQIVKLKSTKRLMSLDALRGFDMFWIIGGSAIITGLARAIGGPLEAIIPQFHHVPWEGLHFEDLIWPLFMFIVGVSIPLSIEKRKTMNSSKRLIYFHVIRRVLILFFLGMVLQGGLLKWDFSQLHPFYSVLHGIAAGYLIAVVVVIELKPKMQLAIIPFFLLLYWILLELVPIPEIGAGVLTPDGNLAIWIDRMVQGKFHFGENTWFLSYMGFASSVLLGVFASHILMSTYTEGKKVMMLSLAGIACITSGLLWSLVFPIIKLLWTSSFVLVSGGFSFLMLALFYYIIEVKGLKRWTLFFRVIGMNSIVVYVATSLISFRQIGNIFVGSLLPRIEPWDEFVSAAFAVTIVWLILYWMYRTKTFVKL